MREEKKEKAPAGSAGEMSAEERRKAELEEAFSRQKEQFIREKVVKKKIPFHERLASVLGRFLSAVFFGLVACLAFVWIKPVLDQYLPPLSTLLPFLQQEEIVSYVEETLPAESEEERSGAGESLPAETEAEKGEKDLSPAVLEAMQEMLSGYSLTDENVVELQNKQARQIITLNESVVKIGASAPGGASGGETAGLLWNATKTEFFFLFDSAALQGTDYQITLASGKSLKAELQGADMITGLAVLSCSREEGEELGLSEKQLVPLGNSFLIHPGGRVICLGNPFGPVFSAGTGVITYISSSNLGIDTDLRLLYTDISLAESGSGFLVNGEGKLVGVITSAVRGYEEGGKTAAIAVSDLKDIMTKLANEGALPYLGIQGTNITGEMAEEFSMPAGIYVEQTLIGGPAYNSGIQNGDILASLDGVILSSMRDLQNQLRSYEPGDVVEIAVLRQGREEYVEQSYQVTLGSR